MICSRKDIMKVIENFDPELYGEQGYNFEKDTLPKVINKGSEEFLDTTISQVGKGFQETETNNSVGKDGVVVNEMK